MDLFSYIPSKQRVACVKVAEIVAQAGGRAMLVGGCVRDSLCQSITKDVDMEIYGLDAPEVEKHLEEHFRLDTVGRAFGVFILKGYSIDISLPRRESSTGPGHKDFEILGDPEMLPEEAASRRDFTINSMSWDPRSGELIDPFNGRKDLSEKCLRHVSNAFSEDPLRVLRGMQFVARFDLKANSETISVCSSLNPNHLPVERIWEEWKKLILKGQSISKGLEFLRETGWVKYFPELNDLIGCEQDPIWHPEGDVWKHTCLCMDSFAQMRVGDEIEDLAVGLAVLCHDIGKPLTSYTDDEGRIRSPGHDSKGVAVTRRFLEKITKHKKLIEAVLPLVAQHMRPLEFYNAKVSDGAIRRLVIKVKHLDRLIRVAHADKGGRTPHEIGDFPEGQWLMNRAKELTVTDSAPKPIIQGRNLIELGMKPGKKFKKILDACYEAQLDGKFNDINSGKAYLKKIL